MNDPYVCPHTAVLKNLADIRDEEILSCMEAEYTSLRLSELVTHESATRFDFDALCSMHRYIFQDIYEWAGNIRIINIEKTEPALGGLSVEYSDYVNVQRDIISTLKSMNEYSLETETLEVVAKLFSGGLADLWKIHPFREGNTRTIVTFCSQFIESRGFYIDSDLFKDNAQYMRIALVAANAIFSDLGDRRKSEYLEHIVCDALVRGQEMKNRVSNVIKKAGYEVTEDRICKIVNWNRVEKCEHEDEEVKVYLLERKSV